LADPNTRQGKRTPVTLKIKFKSETLEQFIERYAVDVSQGGIFIRTKEPLAVGTQMKFEFQLRDASPLIAGEGTVVWTRENDPSRPAIAPGMGVRFDRLADGSQNVLERILAEKAKQAPQRGATEGPTKPPLFTDTPTRVAPAPVQEALGVGSAATRRARSDSEQTPLPPPRPFHSDADDFDEKAFEEATKVRSLEELAAASANLGGDTGDTGEPTESDDVQTNTAIKLPPDELAKRRIANRPDSLDEPVAPPVLVSPTPAMHDRESAPGLPEPPAPAARAKHASESPTKVEELPGRTKLGVEPAKAPKPSDAVPRVVAKEPSLPHAPQRPSAAPVIVMLLVLVAGAAGAVWWFVLREKVDDQVAAKPEIGSQGSQVVATNPPDHGSDGSGGSAGSDGSAGSAVATNPPDIGSAGSAGSAVEPPTTAQIVDTVIATNVTKNVSVEIVGTDMKGPPPFTAKLEKDKAYQARVSAPGYLPKTVAIKGGQDKTTVKLALKPRMIMVVTNPPGADIYVEGVNTQRITPAEVTLTAAQAGRPRVRITLRRPGYKPHDQVVEASAFRDNESQYNTSINATLTVAQKPPTDGGTGSGSATPGGSTPSGSGTAGGGSAEPPPSGGDTEPEPPKPPPPAPTPPPAGSAAPPAGGT
jgi:uncharacterized protein (TIGR02266 family)